MAKMLSNYAINILKQTPEETKINDCVNNNDIETLPMCVAEDSAKALTKKLISTCEGWREKDEAHDDLTVLSVKFKGN